MMIHGIININKKKNLGVDMMGKAENWLFCFFAAITGSLYVLYLVFNLQEPLGLLILVGSVITISVVLTYWIIWMFHQRLLNYLEMKHINQKTVEELKEALITFYKKNTQIQLKELKNKCQYVLLHEENSNNLLVIHSKKEGIPDDFVNQLNVLKQEFEGKSFYILSNGYYKVNLKRTLYKNPQFHLYNRDYFLHRLSKVKRKKIKSITDYKFKSKG